MSETVRDGVDQASAARLRLRAQDAEDLAVIAAFLQDARIPLKEMVYLPGEQKFVGVFTRYRRELQADPRSCEGLTECQSALTVADVAEVKHRGIDPEAPAREIVLLTIATSPGKAHLLHLDMVFEGEARIQLRTDRINVRLEDTGEARICTITPCDHEASVLPGWTVSYDYKA